MHVHDDQVIKEMTGGEGADYCFECIGSVSVMAEAFQSSRSVPDTRMVLQHACDVNTRIIRLLLLVS